LGDQRTIWPKGFDPRAAGFAFVNAAIRRFCDGWNQRCQPFSWTKDADQILAKLNGASTAAATR
jgi:hypothetical protein